MNEKYNLIAGQSTERLAALSDGLFSIAMTLLVLDLHVPDGGSIHSESDLVRALGALVPRIIPYLMTFMTLGIFWVGQQTQLNLLERTDRNFTWIQLGYLLAVSLTPFSTALLASFITYRSALVAYWLNILLLGVVLYASWSYANRADLVRATTAPLARTAIYRRIIIAQTLYGIGAVLSAINTYVSITVILLVQLNYVIGPRFGSRATK